MSLTLIKCKSMEIIAVQIINKQNQNTNNSC